MQNDSFSDTKVSLTLGGETYLLKFGLHTMRRIEETHKGFSLLDNDVPPFEVLPLLIRCAIGENKKWQTEAEFEEMYDSCTDEEALSKVLLAYQNALGFTDRVFTPVVGRISEAIATLTQEAEKAQREKEKQKLKGEK